MNHARQTGHTAKRNRKNPERRGMAWRVMVILVGIMFTGVHVQGQTMTVFSDNFNSNTSNTWTTSGTIGSSAWSVLRSGGDWGARRSTLNTFLELTNDASGGGNSSGWVLASTPSSSFASPFNTTLSSNSGLVTWTFNMRQPQNDPGGFVSGNYGVSFILAGQSFSDNNSGNGYAVVLGQSGTSDYVRLVSFTGGLQGTLTSRITGNIDIGTEYLSIKVTYDPSNNQWELFVRNDGASFADPESGTLTSQGTVINSTYTGTSLPLMGAYWQGGTTANQLTYFDNVKVKEACTLPVINCPSSVTGFVNPATGLVHAWPFNETSGTTANDVIGNQDGTLMVSPSWTSGRFGNAVQLDGSTGTGDYVDLPDGIVQGLTNFSVSTWVYWTSASNWQRIFDFGTSTSNYMFLTPQNGSNSRVRYAITTGSGEQIVDGTSALSLNAWSHVVVTLSGTSSPYTCRLYVNGTLVGTNTNMTLTPNSLGNTTNNYIGESQWNDPTLYGRVDEFRIYNTALSAAQVTDLYTRTANQCAVSTDYGTVGIGSATASGGCGNVSITNNASYPLPVGSNTITWTATDEASNTSTCNQSVTVMPSTVTFTGTLADQCVNNTTYTLTGGSPAGGTYSGPGVSGTNFNASVAGIGTHTLTYSYTFTYADGTSCPGTATNTITVNALPTAGSTVTESSGTANDGIVCAGTSVTLNGTGGTAYSWDNGVANGVPFVPTATTTYTVTVTDGNGCTATTTRTITVNALPAAGSTVTENSGTDNDGIVCEGTSVTLNGTGGTSYSWDNGVINGVPFVPTSTNTYTVTVTDANGCTAATTRTITVNPLPTFKIDQTNVSCNGGNDGSIKITVLSGTPNYVFSKNGGTDWTTPQAGTEYTFGSLTVAGGPYNIRVRDGNQCVATNCQP